MAKTKGTRLTAAQETFAQAVASGMTQSDAFIKAWPKAKKFAKTTLYPEASNMAKLPLVLARIAELQARAASDSIFTLADHLRNLQAISEAALKAEDFNAAARAEEARGKAAGFYVQRTELTGKGGGPIETKQTRDLTDVELDEQLRAHGIDPDSIKPGPAGIRH